MNTISHITLYLIIASANIILAGEGLFTIQPKVDTFSMIQSTNMIINNLSNIWIMAESVPKPIDHRHIRYLSCVQNGFLPAELEKQISTSFSNQPLPYKAILLGIGTNIFSLNILKSYQCSTDTNLSYAVRLALARRGDIEQERYFINEYLAVIKDGVSESTRDRIFWNKQRCFWNMLYIGTQSCIYHIMEIIGTPIQSRFQIRYPAVKQFLYEIGLDVPEGTDSDESMAIWVQNNKDIIIKKLEQCKNLYIPRIQYSGVAVTTE